MRVHLVRKLNELFLLLLLSSPSLSLSFSLAGGEDIECKDTIVGWAVSVSERCY